MIGLLGVKKRLGADARGGARKLHPAFDHLDGMVSARIRAAFMEVLVALHAGKQRGRIAELQEFGLVDWLHDQRGLEDSALDIAQPPSTS